MAEKIKIIAAWVFVVIAVVAFAGTIAFAMKCEASVIQQYGMIGMLRRSDIFTDFIMNPDAARKELKSLFVSIIALIAAGMIIKS